MQKRIHHFLYPFYLEFDADSESVTFYIGRKSLATILKMTVFWTRFAMVRVFFGSGQGYSGPVAGR